MRVCSRCRRRGHCARLRGDGSQREEHLPIAIACILALPVLLLLCVLLVGIVLPELHALTYVMAASALGFLTIAVRPGLPAPRAFASREPHGV